MPNEQEDETLRLKGPDILIVDDNPANLDLLAEMLTPRGFEVRLVNSGRRALSAAQAQPPELILLDINMPQMDGYEVCQQLKAHPATADVPVIFLSSLDEVVDKVKAFGAGGADYVTKPFEFGEVLVRMEHQLKITELQRGMARKNEELARKNAELLRSHQREALAFSALADVLPGSILDGRYRLEEKIGSGGFGAVYRAVHLALDRPVAVKVLHPILRNRGAEELQRFIQEGVSACRLNHPNAVSVFDSGVSPGGVAYLVMELLHGRSLAKELREKKMLSAERCLTIAVPVCRVLAEAHEAGVLHRDIKPENIFLHRVKDEEVVKVVDFGIAKLVRGEEADEPSQALVGTPYYLAPERLEGAGHDGRADVYSLGVTLYRMLGGALPFEPESISGSLTSVSRSSPAPLQSLNPDVSPALAAIVMRAMARNPTERPTARELEPMLRRAVASGEEPINSRTRDRL